MDKKFAISIFFIIMILAIICPTHLSAKEEPVQISSDLVVRKLKKCDPALWISAELVLSDFKNKKENILIDVRNVKDFDKFNVPGSLNIPIHFIKTKTFLKAKTLVLVNEGYNTDQLEAGCKKLKDQGFNAFILDGGLNYWKKIGGAITGDPLLQAKVNMISAKDFFYEKDFENKIIINASKSIKQDLLALVPYAVNISMLDNSENAVSKIKNLFKQQNSLSSAILIFTEDGTNYEKIASIIDKAIKKTFYLEGGLEEYKKYLQQQTLYQNTGKEKRKTAGGCKNCGK